jgi:lysyl-tRNA synthetase class 2
VLFFPQMRPEKLVTVELNENEKDILAIMEENKTMELNKLKEMMAYSNKVWDTSIKQLTKNNLLKVEKTADSLLIHLV